MNQDVPDHWAAAMIAAGCVDPRRKATVASMTQLAERTSLTPETIRRMIRGIGKSDPESVKRVVAVLGEQVWGWVDAARANRDPWTAPAEAEYLTEDEGQTLTRLIRLMTQDRIARADQTPEPRRRALRAVDKGEATPRAAMEKRRRGEVQIPPPGTSEEPDA